MPEIIVLAHNIRSTHNIGSIFRTADGFSVKEIRLSGYSPYPTFPGDSRLPHLREKITHQIHKTALGAEATVPFRVSKEPPIEELQEKGYRLVALEQDVSSVPLHRFKVPEKIALLIGEEVDGISPELLTRCDSIVEIPMTGKKESFNVSVATALALYQFSVVGYNTP
jgi:tRNA G18 (ribose-2'-O)-methylase SpoU